MEKRSRRGFSSFATTATLSVVLLTFAVIWTIQEKNAPPKSAQLVVQASDQNSVDENADLFVENPGSNATSSISGLSPLGDAVLNRVLNAYSGSSVSDVPSTDVNSTAEAVAQTLKPVVQAHVYSPHDLKTTADTSLSRVLAYRSDMRDSLAPLLTITEPEFATFGHYVESHDSSYLLVLQHDADIYRAAASSTAVVLVPEDAVAYHVKVLNAMQGFAAKLDALASHAGDPFATAALLRSYNQGEEDMLTSFNSLAQYYRSKANAASAASSTNS